MFAAKASGASAMDARKAATTTTFVFIFRPPVVWILTMREVSLEVPMPSICWMICRISLQSSLSLWWCGKCEDHAGLTLGGGGCVGPVAARCRRPRPGPTAPGPAAAPTRSAAPGPGPAACSSDARSPPRADAPGRGPAHLAPGDNPRRAFPRSWRYRSSPVVPGTGLLQYPGAPRLDDADAVTLAGRGVQRQPGLREQGQAVGLHRPYCSRDHPGNAATELSTLCGIQPGRGALCGAQRAKLSGEEPATLRRLQLQLDPGSDLRALRAVHLQP